MCLSVCRCEGVQGCVCEEGVPGGQAPHFASGIDTFSNDVTFLRILLPDPPEIPHPFWFPCLLSSSLYCKSRAMCSFSVFALEQVCHFGGAAPPPPTISPSEPLLPPRPRPSLKRRPQLSEPVLLQTEMKMGSHCTMTPSNHYSAKIQMKNQEA